MSIDQIINQSFEPIANAVEGVIFSSIPIGSGVSVELILVWLVLAGVFFTAYLGFINFRYFVHAWKLLFEKGGGDDGQIGRLQALATSLSGTVGLGNIAGVAVAVSVGGAGAAFWMMMAGFLGMSTKFAEVTLGVKYRKHPDGQHKDRISGGPMYYIKAGFEKIGYRKAGVVLAALFAVFCIFGTMGAGSLFQTKFAYNQLVVITGGGQSFFADKAWLFGVVMAIAVGAVIIGGIKSIAAVAGKIVPFMGGLYVAAGLFVIAVHYSDLPYAISLIVHGAFTPQAGFGGFLGVLLVGVQRAAFSNEAGIGSAAIAHAAAKTDTPVTQGMVGMLGPFIDTVVICTITALVIIISGQLGVNDGLEGVALTSRAFETGSSFLPYVLFVVVLLFAYSTMIAWSYYGLKAFTYLFGTGMVKEVGFKTAYCAFVIVGASANLGSVIAFTDAAVFAMAIPNIIGLYILAPELKRDVSDYIKSLAKT